MVTALGLSADAVATPPSGDPPLGTFSPTRTVGALPAAGGDGDDDTLWALYTGLVVAGVVVVATGLLVLARR